MKRKKMKILSCHHHLGIIIIMTKQTWIKTHEENKSKKNYFDIAFYSLKFVSYRKLIWWERKQEKYSIIHIQILLLLNQKTLGQIFFPVNMNIR